MRRRPTRVTLGASLPTRNPRRRTSSRLARGLFACYLAENIPALSTFTDTQFTDTQFTDTQFTDTQF
jgi:hypothetical protein